MHASEQEAQRGRQRAYRSYLECLGVFPAVMIFPNDPLLGDSEEEFMQLLRIWQVNTSEPPHLGQLNINVGRIKHI